MSLSGLSTILGVLSLHIPLCRDLTAVAQPFPEKTFMDVQPYLTTEYNSTMKCMPGKENTLAVVLIHNALFVKFSQISRKSWKYLPLSLVVFTKSRKVSYPKLMSLSTALSISLYTACIDWKFSPDAATALVIRRLTTTSFKSSNF